MQAQARRSRKNSRVPYPRPRSSSPSGSPLLAFVPAFPRTLPAPFERRRSRRPWPPLPVVKLPHETFLMSNRGDLRLFPSLSFPLFPSLSLSLPPFSLCLPQLFLFLAVHPSVFLPFRTFADLSPVPAPSVPPSVCFPRVAFPSFVFPRYSHRPTSSRTRERPRWSPRRSPSCAKEAPNVGLRAAATQ